VGPVDYVVATLAYRVESEISGSDAHLAQSDARWAAPGLPVRHPAHRGCL